MERENMTRKQLRALHIIGATIYGTGLIMIFINTEYLKYSILLMILGLLMILWVDFKK